MFRGPGSGFRVSKFKKKISENCRIPEGDQHEYRGKVVFLSMGKEEQFQMVEIFTGTPWQCGMVKTLLEDAGIEAFLADEIVGMLYPWWTSPGGASPVRVLISSLDQDRARAIVGDYQKNLK